MFEVREIETGDTYARRTGMGRALDTADALHLGTGKHFAVVRVEMVYDTSHSTYDLRPEYKVLSRGLKAGYAHWRSLRERLTPATHRG